MFKFWLFKTLLNPVSVFLIIVALVIMSVPIIPKQYTVTEYTYDALSYEMTSPVILVSKSFLLFFKRTEAHQGIKNTDSSSGTFSLNFVFNNGIERETITENVKLLPGEEKEVKTKVPLSGDVDVEVNVIPPYRPIPEETLMEKKVNVWSIIGSWLNPFD